MSQFTVLYVVSGKEEQYLEEAAKARGISKTQIVRRAVDFILKDKLFLSIFDDGDKPSPKTEGGGRGRKSTKYKGIAPRESFDTTVSHSVPTRTIGRQRVANASVPKTKAEFEQELRDAVLNTGGELSEPRS